MDLAVVAASFLLIVPVELPDKTFVATLVLATRFAPAPVWAGVGLAFAVQCLVAVTLGGLLTALPQRPITLAAAALFVIGAVLLLRGAANSPDGAAEIEREFSARAPDARTGLRAVGTGFLVLFLAEWGDLSQLLTAGLVVRYGDPASVFAGAWCGLLLVSGIAAVTGRALLRRLSLALIRRIGAAACALLAALTLLSLFEMP